MEGLKSGFSVGMQAAMMATCSSRLENHNEMSVLGCLKLKGREGTCTVFRAGEEAVYLRSQNVQDNDAPW